jgi:hypothetical protein
MPVSWLSFLSGRVTHFLLPPSSHPLSVQLGFVMGGFLSVPGTFFMGTFLPFLFALRQSSKSLPSSLIPVPQAPGLCTQNKER